MGEKILEFKRATAEDLEDYMKAKIDAFSDDLCTYGFGPTGYKKIGETELRENKNGFFLYEYENRGLAKAVFSECIKRGMSKGIKEFSISAREEKQENCIPHSEKHGQWKEITALTLTKSVYSDGKLQLYIPELDGNYEVTCYDADFQQIDEDFGTDYKKGIYTIEGEAVERISGIVLKEVMIIFTLDIRIHPNMQFSGSTMPQT